MKTLGILLLAGLAFCALLSAAEKALPAPVSEKIYTFQQIEAEKAALKDKVVRIELAKLLGKGSLEGDGLMHYIAKDASGTATPYGQIAFPKEGLEKTGLANPDKGPLVVYVRVHLFEDKKAAALHIAVGTHVSVSDGNAVYSW
jgi:hypothetical protein